MDFRLVNEGTSTCTPLDRVAALHLQPHALSMASVSLDGPHAYIPTPKYENQGNNDLVTREPRCTTHTV